MWKNLVFGLMIAGFSLGQSISCKADILLSWNTAGNLGTETSEPSVTNDANLAAANLTLGAGVVASTNGNRFGGSNWFDTGNTAAGSTIAEAVAGNNFIQFVVTPSGATFSATSLDFIWDRSGTGPSSVALRSSIDGFATDLGTVTGMISGGNATTTLRSIAISGVNDISTSTTFRLYGFGTTAVGGTGGFDTATGATTPNVVFNGTITAVPEPTSIVLLSLAGSSGLVVNYRRRKSRRV